MKGNKILLILAVTATLFLSGCQTMPQQETEQDYSVMKAVGQDLRTVAKSIREKNKQLAILEQEKLRQDGVIPPAQREQKHSRNLEKKLTLHWSAEVEPLLAVITKDIGYKAFGPKYIEGVPPLNKSLVSVNVTQESAYEVLKDIGWQLGTKAKLVVDDHQKTVRLIYLGE